MPNRYVRESAIESETVNRLSWAGEVFYRRLINRVDDFGRFTANLELLRASIFPLRLNKITAAGVGKLLTECVDAGLVSTWRGQDGKEYLVMHKWEKGRAHSSRYPEPPAYICERLQTNVCRREQIPPTTTTTPIPTTTPSPLPPTLISEFLRTYPRERFRKQGGEGVWVKVKIGEKGKAALVEAMISRPEYPWVRAARFERAKAAGGTARDLLTFLSDLPAEEELPPEPVSKPQEPENVREETPEEIAEAERLWEEAKRKLRRVACS